MILQRLGIKPVRFHAYHIFAILFPYFFHIISILFPYYFHIFSILFPYSGGVQNRPRFCPHVSVHYWKCTPHFAHILEVPTRIWDASRHQGSQNLWSLGESKAHEVRYRAMFQQHLQNIVKIDTFAKCWTKNMILCRKNLCLAKVR